MSTMAAPTLSLFTALLAATLCFSEAAVLKNGVVVPTYAEVCHRSSQDFDDCLKSSIQTLLNKIAKRGIKELGVGGLDPMHIPELLMNFGGAGYTFKSFIRSSYTHGFSKVKILNVRSDFKDPENINLEVDFYMPKVVTEGNYKIDGSVADFPVNGKGVYNISMVDVQGTFKMNAHVITVDGEEYMRVHRIGLRPDVGNMNVYFSNLVHGNPELSSIALTFFNQFWKIIYPEILPYAEEGFDKVLRNMLNQATLKIPYNQLIPL